MTKLFFYIAECSRRAVRSGGRYKGLPAGRHGRLQSVRDQGSDPGIRLDYRNDCGSYDDRDVAWR